VQQQVGFPPVFQHLAFQLLQRFLSQEWCLFQAVSATNALVVGQMVLEVAAKCCSLRAAADAAPKRFGLFPRPSFVTKTKAEALVAASPSQKLVLVLLTAALWRLAFQPFLQAQEKVPGLERLEGRVPGLERIGGRVPGLERLGGRVPGLESQAGLETQAGLEKAGPCLLRSQQAQ